MEGGEFEEGSVLNFNKVDSASEQAKEVFEKLSGIGVNVTDASKAFIYDISVMKDGKEVQPNGKVKLTVSMPQEDDISGYLVYHVENGGQVVEIPATYANGKVTFETDGFSCYVFVTVPYATNNIPQENQHNLTIAVEPADGGRIEIDGEERDASNGVSLEADTTHSINAVANEGYRFVGWFAGETNVSEDAGYTFAVNEDTTLVARFEADVPAVAPTEVTLIATAGQGGSVTGGYAAGKKVEQGASVTLRATPNTGYHFVGWFSGEANVSADASYTFTVNVNTTLLAKFEKDTSSTSAEVTLTATAGQGGNVTGGYAIGKKVKKGASVTLTATPNTGYHFVGWFAGQTNVSAKASYTFAVNENMTLLAKFEKDTSTAPAEITLTATAGQGGSVTGGYATGKKVKKGTSVALTATPNSGYRFVGWYNSADNSLISSQTTHTFVCNANISAYAKFEEKVADGSLTKAEWDAAMAYYAAQTNVKVVERISFPTDNDPYGTGAQIMIYQFKDAACFEDGYFENDAALEYKGKASYFVKEGNTYSYIYWGYVTRDEEGWVKNSEDMIQSSYESQLKNIYGWIYNGEPVDFSYANFTYDATTKTYKNSEKNVTVSFTFDNRVLTKIVVTIYRASDSGTFERTITFGNADFEVPEV